MNWRRIIRTVKRAIPPSILNEVLLAFPFLYRTRLVYYETNLKDHRGIDELLAQLSLVLNVEGSVIECGSSRCGTSIIMADYSRSRGIRKTVYACDSFEGFDPVELAEERKAGLADAPDWAFTSTSYEYVRRKVRRLGLEGMVVPVKGFFQDTLPQLRDKFCFALIDCDLARSTLYCAETLWPKLTSNGRIVFDDYHTRVFRGARLGIESFVTKYGHEMRDHGVMTRLYYVCKAPEAV
jgi:hypothetical protein